jgi:hypothetical protein
MKLMRPDLTLDLGAVSPLGQEPVALLSPIITAVTA